MEAARRRLWMVVPAFLSIVAIAHPAVVDRLDMVAWIGAGFGMFATVDGDDRVIVTEGNIVSDPNLTNAPFGPKWQRFQERAETDSHSLYKPAFDPETNEVTWLLLRR